jgi:hypothetical protein
VAGIEIAQVDPSTDRLSAEKILAVQRSAYAVEAELIGDDRIPLLHESVDDLCAAQVHWLVALDLDEILGAAAWSGRGLLTAALNCIAGERVLVATGRDNAPARRLYESLGFAHTENQEVLPGLWLARYELNR